MVTTYTTTYSGFKGYQSLDQNTVLATSVIIPDAMKKDAR